MIGLSEYAFKMDEPVIDFEIDSITFDAIMSITDKDIDDLIMSDAVLSGKNLPDQCEWFSCNNKKNSCRDRKNKFCKKHKTVFSVAKKGKCIKCKNAILRNNQCRQCLLKDPANRCRVANCRNLRVKNANKLHDFCYSHKYCR